MKNFHGGLKEFKNVYYSNLSNIERREDQKPEMITIYRDQNK